MKITQKLILAVASMFIMFGFSVPVFAAGSGMPDPVNSEYKCSTGTSDQQCLKDNPIVKWINYFANLFAVIVLVGAAVMMTYAGVQYAAAADSPDKLKAAKKLIWDIIIGLLAFFFLYAFMQWLIPGGIF